MRKTLLLTILLFVAPHICLQAVNKRQVRFAVEQQMERYPLSTLQDIYKNFFQSRFGPGHIVSDTTNAGAYLRKELTLVQDLDVPLYETCAENDTYYRVALAAIKSGAVSYEAYFGAFIRSVTALPEVNVSDWTKEWRKIENTIRGMHLNLPEYEKDVSAIEEVLAQGKYAIHHSRLYHDTYQPHYRLMEKKIFEKEILPLIEAYERLPKNHRFEAGTKTSAYQAK